MLIVIIIDISSKKASYLYLDQSSHITIFFLEYILNVHYIISQFNCQYLVYIYVVINKNSSSKIRKLKQLNN